MSLEQQLAYPFDGLKKETLQELVSVTEDFSAGLLDFISNYNSRYSIMYGDQEKRFSTFKKDYTIREMIALYRKHLEKQNKMQKKQNI